MVGEGGESREKGETDEKFCPPPAILDFLDFSRLLKGFSRLNPI
jgi:hypothetical protein